MRTFLAIALLALALPAHAATLVSARAKVDTWLTNNFPLVISKQATYLAAHGRYWQGLLTVSGTNAIPNFTAGADGDAIADNLASKPYYEAESISDIFPTFVGVALPCAFLCDQYDGPLGRGYVVTVFLRFNSVIYVRSHNTGPESWRESAWAQFIISGQ
jgi:hypothetical protein